MKKIFIISIILMMISSSFLVIADNSNISNENEDSKNVDFTHTVFAEECTATWCPNCPMAATALYNIVNSSDYPFYFVSLVDDMNPIANDRNLQYTFGIIRFFSLPTVYFDGGNTNFVGRGMSVEATENEYRELIEAEGLRTPKEPILLESDVSWDGNARITVTITATNQGSSLFVGILRSYVTEIESRWDDRDGNPYHYSLLDFAIKKLVFLPANKAKVFTGTFDGNINRGNDTVEITFEDIVQENILVISTVSHIMPIFRSGSISEQWGEQKYFGFIVDQTVASNPE